MSVTGGTWRNRLDDSKECQLDMLERAILSRAGITVNRNERNLLIKFPMNMLERAKFGGITGELA